MKKVLENYRSTILLIVSLIIGAIIGILAGERAAILKPFGDLFINLTFIIIVPLIFFTLTTSIAKIKSIRRLGKIAVTTLATFFITSLVAVLFGLLITSKFELVSVEDGEKIKNELDYEDTSVEGIECTAETIIERTISLLSVNDFNKLLSKDNLVALVIISILVGIAVIMTGEEAKIFVDFIASANAVLLRLIQIIMYYAPIGLGCYFANLVGTFGKEIAIGYAKTFFIYTIASIVFFMVLYTLYAFIAGGKKGIKAFWKHVLTPAATAVSTCSSSASITVNAKALEKIGVSSDIANTIVPLGTSFHKDGSVIGSVFKIMFLVYLFGANIASGGYAKIILVALIATLLVVAVPIGGGTISEMLILTLMGYPVAALPILTMIATVIDPAATMLNVVGDTASGMLVARVVDGKKWLEMKMINKIKNNK